ncbi:hypothetical protein Tco_0624411 [Tanacetum coccineum]|uniref:RNA-directed DNA polymerase, eukaryota, reverse transcriptase zinc-binding domain protein n=1 Tax=Tanacetum coccineum TaxID=301880 RepID=A0ABQ4WDX0_9ASTR
MEKVDSWKVIMDKFKKRLGNWKTKMMSCGGRLTLIKSVLDSLARYFFSLFHAPVNGGGDLELKKIDFGSFEKKLCNGNNALSWLVSWIGDGVVLSGEFPRLYRLEINKDIMVDDKRVWRNDTWDWRWD